MADKVFNNMRCLVGLMVVSVSIGTTHAQGCQDGWTEYRNACFKLFPQTGAMSSANSVCDSFGGNVVRPKTQGIQALIQGMMLDHPEADYWLHMIRSPHITGGWTYLDGTWLIDCDFTNWGPASDGESSSNDGANTEQCGRLLAATQWQWEDTPCGDSHSTICQTGDVIGTSSGSCGSDFANNMPCSFGYTAGPGDICYKVSATVATFSDAEADCASQGGRLAAPYDERTHQFMAGMAMLVNPNSDHWIGITTDTVNGGFKFIDDTQLPQCGFMKWAAGQPDTSMSGGYLDSSVAYNWAAGDPSTEKHYICQKAGSLYTCERGPTSCTADQFACPCGGCCLETAQLCDRVDDCTDGSDELGCDFPTTPAATTTIAAATTTPAVTTIIPAVTTVMATTASDDANIVTTTTPDDDTPDDSTRAPVTGASLTTSRPEEGGSAAANRGGVPAGPVAGGVVGAVAVVGAGAAVGGYLMYKKKQMAVDPTP
ncbi:macrophage mannose receptor 1-like [Branchiostoma lanceolatum]|uniref:macrophage mannose receptor 1-like n=1 Tax=Branchiostoma lanceolatum TaxID=7740 RepID=UPI003456E7AD